MALKMPNEKPPYITSPGLVTKVLDKIKQAATPPRFTQDFLNKKLAMTGGAANMLIPFLKKIGFLNTDGSPTVIYSRYRNDTESGTAVADAMRLGYKSLFEVNEKAHEIGDDALKGLIVQVTGQSKDDQVTKLIFSCFKGLKSRADFDTVRQLAVSDKSTSSETAAKTAGEPSMREFSRNVEGIGMNLSYTINLNLPASTDIAVFNAIFQSLRKNLLRDE
jgi:Family of unknown function (DUF5343)